MTANTADIMFPFLRNYTKFIQHGDLLYRVKVKYDQESFKDRKETFSRTELSCEIEQCLRAVMYMYLHEKKIKPSPIASDHLLVLPTLRRWDFPLKYPNYGFKRNGKVLKAASVNIEFTVKHIDECVVKEHTSVPHTVKEKTQAVNGHMQEKQYLLFRDGNQEERVSCPGFVENRSVTHRQCGDARETKHTVTSQKESEPYKTKTGQCNNNSECTVNSKEEKIPYRRQTEVLLNCSKHTVRNKEEMISCNNNTGHMHSCSEHSITNIEQREPHENKTQELPSYLEMIAGTELERRKRDPVSIYQDILQHIKKTRLKEMTRKNYKSFPQANLPMEGQLGLLKSHTKTQMDYGRSLRIDSSNGTSEVECSLSN